MSLSLGFFSLRRPLSRGRSAFGSPFASASAPAFELLLLEPPEDSAASLSFAAAAAALLDTSSGNGLSFAASPGFCAGCWSASGAEGASAGWLCCSAACFDTSAGNGFSSAADFCAGGCFCLRCAGDEDWLPESPPEFCVPDCCATAGRASAAPNPIQTASNATKRPVT